MLLCKYALTAQTNFDGQVNQIASVLLAKTKAVQFASPALDPMILSF